MQSLQTSKMASATNTLGKLRFYNNSESDVKVTVAGDEVRLIEKSSSSSFEFNVGGEGEKKGAGSRGGGGQFNYTQSKSSTVKYDWSPFIKQGERIVKRGTSEEFFAGNDSFQKSM